MEAENQGLDVNSICQEALLLAINRDKTNGTTESAIGKFLNYEALRKTDVEVLRRSFNKKDANPNNLNVFRQILKLYMEKYQVDLNQAILIAEGKREK
jgi:hypothetical protein